jgi:microcystin-dependent protein
MEVYVGTIMGFGFNFAPRGWMTCQGQILSIAQNTALFSLLGVTYGGNGQTTFGLPNLGGRMAMGQSSQYQMGEMAGTPTATLTIANMPMHTHTVAASTTLGASPTPSNTSVLTHAHYQDSNTGNSVDVSIYGPPDGNMTTLSPQAIGVSGGSQPFSTISPYLVINYCIATQGIFPSRN